eukprot:gene2904-3336_t
MQQADYRMKNDVDLTIREIIGRTDESYEEWNQSKTAIRKVCESSNIPANLRFLVWKHLVHNNLNAHELVVPSLQPSPPNGSMLGSSLGSIQLDSGGGSMSFDQFQRPLTPTPLTPTNLSSSYNSTPIFHNEMLNRDCNQLTYDYHLIDQIQSLGNNNNSSNNNDPLAQKSEDTTIAAGLIAERLQRFVRNFCTQTNREYSIDVAKLIAPFVVLSFSDPTTTSDEDWMNLSIKIVEHLSNSGLLAYPSANPILQCETEMFRILLLYHNPVLSYFLDQRSVFCSAYFYSWINHMFSGCIEMQYLVQLWDILLFNDNQDFYLYFALALLTSKEEQILSVKGTAKDILSVLDEKSFSSTVSSQLKLIVKKAEQYRLATPFSFIRTWNKFYTNCKHPNGPRLDTINLIHKDFKYSLCMNIDVEELILCSEFGAEQLISQPEEFDGVKKSHEDKKGVAHFTFYDNWLQFNTVVEKNDADTNDNGDMNMNILRFLKEGFPYISRVNSGYKKIHDIFIAKGLKLAVHESDRCPVCNPDLINNPLPPVSAPTTPIVSPPPKAKWFDKFKSLGNKRDTQTPPISSPTIEKEKRWSSGTASSSMQRLNSSLGNLLSDFGPPATLALDSVSPFVIDSDDDMEEDDFRGNPRFYYYPDDDDDDGSHYYQNYYVNEPIQMPSYDHARVKAASEMMEKGLKEYRGLEDWLEGSNLIFECDEVFGDNGKEPRYIILSDDRFIVLRQHAKCAGYVKIDMQYELEDIRRIVYKKSVPNLLEFRFSQDDQEDLSASSRNLLISSSSSIGSPMTSPTSTNNNGISASSTSTTTADAPNFLKKFYLFLETDPILKAIKDRTSTKPNE